MNVGKLIIFSGPSGVGKDTVLDAWRKVNPRVRRVVAYTTRAPREGEVDGVDYHFVSRERFQELADSGAFLEHKEVFGNHYATPLSDLEAMLSRGLIAILKIDVQGAVTAMGLRPDAITVFVLPPNMQALEDRIRSRGLDSAEDTERRLSTAQREIAFADRYQHRLINDEVDNVVRNLQEIVNS